MEKKYWTDKHLLEQIKAKVLPIAEALYLRYELLFIFDNVTSHAIYAKDALQVTYMNKRPGVNNLFYKQGNIKRSMENNCTRILFINQKSNDWQNNKSPKKHPSYFRGTGIIAS